MKDDIIIEKKNGYGKEYLNNDKIINDDNYKSFLQLQDKYYNYFPNKIEKRKKYDNKRLIAFEGEYINGEKSKGIIKNYNKYGILIFECEYIDGEIKGNAIEYWDNEELIENGYYKSNLNSEISIKFSEIQLKFQGDYINGERNGKGKEYENDKLIFEGEYLNGERNGKGKQYDYLGRKIFEGEYLNQKRWNGKYKVYYDYENLIFEGEYIN